ncbi:MAG: hypothetical protein COC01_03170 [Bacteroidetes bacterium]|nr:MAG: hypothetical protein COC01_03170 [Bacteroidota bacterium]
MRLLTFLFCFLSFFSFSQVFDDFSDGDFTTNPVWIGDTANFKVNTSSQLQLDAPAETDTSYISTSNTYLSSTDSTEWQFYVKLAFSPSSSNFSQVYLVSDQSDLKGSLNGYFVRIGGESGSTDGIDLYKQTGNTATQIIDGIEGHAGKDPNTLRIKVIRESNGTWYLYADTIGTKDYVLEGTVIDSTHKTSTHFGFWCNYTSTRSTKSYIDDIFVGEPIVDKTPPTIDTVTAVTSKVLAVTFSEIIEESTSETNTNYNLSNSMGNPEVVNRDSSNLSRVFLTFANFLDDSTTYSLTISNVTDLEGNEILDGSTSQFFYVEPLIPGYKDIVINEIMADPSPAVTLPVYEFFEIFNTSKKPVTLTGWKFQDGGSSFDIPEVTIDAGNYLVLCDDEAVNEFLSFGKAIGISSFPSLTNGGESITLLNSDNKTIDYVDYDDSWYDDDAKKDGGWTLELINSYLPCSNQDNWSVSTNVAGGTPGTQNSLYSTTPDVTSPEATQTSVINDSTISISFSEPVDSLTAATYNNYSIDNSIGYPKSISLNQVDYSSVTLTINSLQSSIIYTITLNNIQDCSGNIISANTKLNIGLPDKIDSLDLVINEVLFNPFTGGSDFVEIYNRSKKILNLNDLILAETDANGDIDNAYDVTSNNSLIFPDEYVALTKDVSHLKSNYTIMDANAFIEMSSTPSYDDDEGTVVITDSSGNKIDQFSYTDDMHFALLDDDNGVSLERIDPERKTNDATNWNSAAAFTGYATPGYENSQLIPTTITSSNISVNPEVFSPDNDGYNDVVNISYKFTESSYVGNVYIYNARGQYITQILKNETLTAEGTISWDGINDNGEKAQIGIYVIYFEVFDLSGNVQKFKTSCVLGGKL